MTDRISRTMHQNVSQLTQRYGPLLCKAGSGTVCRATRVPHDGVSAATLSATTWTGRQGARRTAGDKQLPLTAEIDDTTKLK
jgi:hypothetical protein